MCYRMGIDAYLDYSETGTSPCTFNIVAWRMTCWCVVYLSIPTSNHNLIHSHIFKSHVLDIDAYIIVWEYDSGDFILHSISDAQDFMKYVKKR